MKYAFDRTFRKALCCVSGLFYNRDVYFKTIIFAFSTFILIGPVLLALYFSTPKKKWVFNRKTQMVSVPGKYYKRCYEKKLDELYVKSEYSFAATADRTGKTSYHTFPIIILPIKGPDLWFNTNWVSLFNLGNSNSFSEIWSYIIWYMDSNRPLPPGEKFDKFREKDFQKRKEKGFPLPLYYSQIPTLEYKPHLQSIRALVWNHEMFCPDINKYGKCNLSISQFKLPKGSLEYSKEYNPEKWTYKELKEPTHFSICTLYIVG